MSENINQEKQNEERPQIVNKRAINPWFASSLVLLLVIVYLIGKSQNTNILGLFTENSDVFPTKISQSAVEPSEIPSPVVFPTKIPQPTIEPSENPSPVIKKTYYTQPTIDPDPIINCIFSYSKKTLKLKQSLCSQYTDCGFLNGLWIPMSINECKIKQAEERSNTGNQYYRSSQPTEEDYIKSGSVKCETSVGTYWLSPESCEMNKKIDAERLQSLEENYINTYIYEVNRQNEEQERQKEIEKEKQECIQQQESLFNELCGSVKKLDPNASCELLQRETAKQIDQCRNM